MSRFYINSESSEDTFDAAGDLQEAIRIAKEVVRKVPVGEPVCIEHDGKNIRQYVLRSNGQIDETPIAPSTNGVPPQSTR